jgi:uroporphyrinogen-III synthase
MPAGTPAQGIRVLITRPEEDSTPFAAAVKAQGMEPLLQPIMAIHPEEGAKPRLLSLLKEKPRALLITSANGIRAFARLTEERALPVITVGEASAAEARALGFADVTAAGGDSTKLAALVRQKVKPSEGYLLHIAGSVTKGNLKETLTKEGFAVERVVAYRAEPISHFTSELKAALINCELDVATFFSARTLSIFDRLVEISGLSYLLRHVELVTLSADITSVHSWKSRQVAATPTADAMLDLLARLQSARMR